MAKRKEKEVVVEEPVEEVVVAAKTYIGENGEVYQVPTPVVPIENAVAKDAPIYTNLPEIK